MSSFVGCEQLRCRRSPVSEVQWNLGLEAPTVSVKAEHEPSTNWQVGALEKSPPQTNS